MISGSVRVNLKVTVSLDHTVDGTLEKIPERTQENTDSAVSADNAESADSADNKDNTCT